MQKAFQMDPIPTDRPLMYHGLSDRTLAPDADAPLPSEADGIDFEGEFGVVVDNVPMGISVAGTIIGSGTVSNAEYRSVGSSCISERRSIEMLDLGAPQTDYLRFGDRVRMAAMLPDGSMPFGAIDQMTVRAAPPAWACDRFITPARRAMRV